MSSFLEWKNNVLCIDIAFYSFLFFNMNGGMGLMRRGVFSFTVDGVFHISNISEIYVSGRDLKPAKIIRYRSKIATKPTTLTLTNTHTSEHFQHNVMSLTSKLQVSHSTTLTVNSSTWQWRLGCSSATCHPPIYNGNTEHAECLYFKQWPRLQSKENQARVRKPFLWNTIRCKVFSSWNLN